MMNYRSFCGIPVSMKDRNIALVAFHAEPNAFDASFVTSARLAAEQVGRHVERGSLYETRRNEATLASFGMALASLAHELASALTALDANVTDYANAAVQTASDLDAGEDAALMLRQIRSDVSEMTRKTHILRGTRLRSEHASIAECLRKAAAACRTVISETIAQPDRILLEPLGSELTQSWEVFAPPSSLMIVFFNLYLNAAQQIALASSVRKPGKVWQSGSDYIDEAGRTFLRVRIHDSGPGIHWDDWERVFEPGYSTKPNGSGLGLYICRHILNSLGGTVAVTASRIWDGTTMTVSLPLASQKEGKR
jgi:signal transduction histidine kinase